jgi:hypothetical protein
VRLASSELMRNPAMQHAALTAAAVGAAVVAPQFLDAGQASAGDAFRLKNSPDVNEFTPAFAAACFLPR